MRHGLGRVILPNGSFYYGLWNFDKKNGDGTLYIYIYYIHKKVIEYDADNEEWKYSVYT